MIEKAQKAALTILKNAKKDGTLEPAIETELAGMVSEWSRPRIAESLTAEETPKAPPLSDEQKFRLFTNLRDRCMQDGINYIDFYDVQRTLEDQQDEASNLNTLTRPRLITRAQKHLIFGSEGHDINQAARVRGAIMVQRSTYDRITASLRRSGQCEFDTFRSSHIGPEPTSVWISPPYEHWGCESGKASLHMGGSSFELPYYDWHAIIRIRESGK